MERKRRKVHHVLKLLSNLENMKKKKIACDFQIRVNDRSFPVHRAVLIATSAYFEGLFSSNMKEVSDGYIVMRGMTIDGIECCIEFTYTGVVQITSSNVQSVLEASHLMQIDDLIEICLQYLRDNLSVQTSLLTMKLFRLYGTTEDQTTTDEYVNRHFKRIVQTDTFPLVSKDDLIRYLKTSNLEFEFHWKTIVTWMEQNIVEEKEQFFTEAVANLLERGERTLSFIVGKVWRHPFVQTNDRAKDLVLGFLSVQEDALNREVNLEICFSLKEIIKKYDFANSDRFNKILDQHLSENFEEAIKKEEFYVFSFEDLTAILTSCELYCHEESVKWEVLLKWLKHVESREKYLPDLMKLITFEKISVEYIQRNIRSEPLFQKSGKCKDILLDAMCAPASILKPEQPSTLVMLDEGSGILTALDVENGHHTEITRVEKKDFLKITSVKGELYLIQNEEIYKYSNTGIWEKRQSLKKCPWDAHVLSYRKKIYVIDDVSLCSYSPSENVWKEGLPGCGYGYVVGVAVSQIFIYAFGTSGDVRRFDSSSKTWIEMCHNRQYRICAVAVGYREKLYVIGGYSDGEYLRSVDLYDPSNNTWGLVENMNRPRDNFSAVIYNDRLYVVGGDCTEKGGSLDKDSIEVFDQALNKWRIVQEMPKTEGKISTCVVRSLPAKD